MNLVSPTPQGLLSSSHSRALSYKFHWTCFNGNMLATGINLSSNIMSCKSHFAWVFTIQLLHAYFIDWEWINQFSLSHYLLLLVIWFGDSSEVSDQSTQLWKHLLTWKLFKKQAVELISLFALFLKWISLCWNGRMDIWWAIVFNSLKITHTSPHTQMLQ